MANLPEKILRFFLDYTGRVCKTIFIMRNIADEPLRRMPYALRLDALVTTSQLHHFLVQGSSVWAAS